MMGSWFLYRQTERQKDSLMLVAIIIFLFLLLAHSQLKTAYGNFCKKWTFIYLIDAIQSKCMQQNLETL